MGVNDVPPDASAIEKSELSKSGDQAALACFRRLYSSLGAPPCTNYSGPIGTDKGAWGGASGSTLCRACVLVSIIVSEPGVLAAQLQRIADTKKPSSTCTFIASRLIHAISNLAAHALLVQRKWSLSNAVS
jgi:hypothetical protein